jgi:hypothetical protein
MSVKIYDPAFRDRPIVRRLDVGDEGRSKEAARVAGALQTAIFNSVNFSSIATDARHEARVALEVLPCSRNA